MADDSRQASVPVVPTPRMMDEGWSVLLDWDSRDFPDRQMVADVFKAMIEAAPQDWLVALSESKRCHPSS